jgi:hypothetical protein
VKLGRQPQSRCFLKELCTDKKMGRLALADVDRFACRAHCRCEVAILAQSLGENGTEGGVGVDDKDPSCMAAGIEFSRLCHKVLIRDLAR